MVNKKVNLLCGIITIIPIIVSIIVQGQIVNNPSTHIFTKGGSVVDKHTFLFLLIATSLLYYFIAIMISEKFTLFDKSYFRITINVLLSGANLVLIISNLN